MATRIDAIFDALADMDVLFQRVAGGSYSVVPVYNIDDLPEAIYETDLPRRLLLTLGTRTEARSITPVTLSGSAATIGWKITDLFLLKPVGAGAGIATEAPTLLRYIKAYVDACQSIGFKLARVSTMQNMAFEMIVAEYPAGSEAFFFAVEVTNFITEIAQP
jgi:hypothetical protein